MSASGATQDPPVPERIGRYDVLVPLGRGGMATVYLARAEVVPGVSRDYALKLMHPHLRGDPEWATHLLHEAKIAARIRHPNVVPLVEAGDDPLGLYLVLDFIEGETLSGLSRALRAQSKSLPLTVSGRILLDALAGLHGAHELLDESGEPLGLVHRDFSPQNILVGVDGIGRLTDFGIAKAEDSQATATGVLKGKISYMSPEQARGTRVDRRCDVWAAGVIAWELLAGRRLYAKRNETETLLAVVQQVPPKLREVRADIPQELEAVVAHALSPDPELRIADARTLGERLEAAWTAYVGVASTREVSELVRAAVAPAVAKRKAAIERVLAVREGVSGRHLPQLPASAEDSASGDSLVVGHDAGPEKESGTGFQAVTPAGRTRKVAASVSLVVVGAAAVGIGFVVWGRGQSADASGVAPAPSSVTPSAPAPPPVESSSPPAAQQASVLLRANQKLTKVRLGRRNVDVVPPATKVELELLPSEIGVQLEIEATNEAGKVASATLGKNQGSLELRFEPVRRFVPRVTPKPKPGDELAPTPFKKK